MILSDADLRQRLADLNIETSNPNFAFDPATQIQPCSIDLRLGDIAWKPRRRKRIDLSNNAPLGPQITEAFERVSLSYPKGYLLKPGQMLLCRTYEKFSIPVDLMGRLAGRSSLGRLGLSVVGPSNFINPGWRGHMPLTVLNESPFSVRLYPYLGIVQFCLSTLTQPPQRIYGAVGLGSKYIEDDGGPSKYWLDVTIQQLKDNRDAIIASNEAQGFLQSFASELDEPTRRRLLRRIDKAGVISNVDDTIESFVSSERTRQAITYLLPIIVSVPLAIIVPEFFNLWSGGLGSRLLLGGLVGAAVLLLVWIFRAQLGTTIQPGELVRIAANLKRKA